MIPEIKTGEMGRPFTVLNTVGSSNNYAMEAVHAGKAGHGATFFALEQTEGRGQRGKTWYTKPGENLILSMVVEPPLFHIQQPFQLNWIVSLAARKLFDKYANGEVSIKWPNDVYWRDRKAAGILIDTVRRGDSLKWAICGTGMNINQVVFPETARKPVSLRQITGKTNDPLEMAYQYCRFTDEFLSIYREQGAGKILELYNAHLYGRTKTMKFRKNNVVFETTVSGVNTLGQLCTKNAVEQVFDFGEVEWV